MLSLSELFGGSKDGKTATFGEPGRKVDILGLDKNAYTHEPAKVHSYLRYHKSYSRRKTEKAPTAETVS